MTKNKLHNILSCYRTPKYTDFGKIWYNIEKQILVLEDSSNSPATERFDLNVILSCLPSHNLSNRTVSYWGIRFEFLINIAQTMRFDKELGDILHE